MIGHWSSQKRKGTDTVESSTFPDQSGSSPDAGTLTVGSLFSGIGGFELGFEATGRFETRWQVECDPYATKVLEKHWPDVKRHDDVCTWPNKTTEPVDVLIGGFPCQDISYAGEGAGLDGERSGLFYELMRIVRVVGPKYVVLENVAALFTRGMDQVLGTLASHGYDAEWATIQASDVGAPHKRERVFIIAWHNPQGQTAKRTEDGYICLSCGAEIFSGCECDHGEWVCNQCGNYTYPFHYDRNQDACVHCGSDDVSDAFGKRGCSGAAGIKDAANAGQQQGDQGNRKRGSVSRLDRMVDGVSQWMDEPNIPRVGFGIKKRADRLRCLGNAIVPQVAQVVAERLLEIHDQNN
jgi:DNA (cytosine-5)-methyltransferase 1